MEVISSDDVFEWVKDLFFCIVEAMESHDLYIQWRVDAVGN